PYPNDTIPKGVSLRNARSDDPDQTIPEYLTPSTPAVRHRSLPKTRSRQKKVKEPRRANRSGCGSMIASLAAKTARCQLLGCGGSRRGTSSAMARRYVIRRECLDSFSFKRNFEPALTKSLCLPKTPSAHGLASLRNTDCGFPLAATVARVLTIAPGLKGVGVRDMRRRREWRRRSLWPEARGRFQSPIS